MTRNAILNAFSPAQEVVDPRLFAGRHEQVMELSDALRTAGSCPVIYGDRGLGKTSLAVQCQLIAMGHDELLVKLGAKDRVLNEQEMFLTFFVDGAEVTNFVDLQQRIINSFRDFVLQDQNGSGRQVLVDRQTRRNLSLKIFEVEETKNYVNRVNKLRDEDLSLTEQIKREAELLYTCYGQPVLVVIDELDRVDDTRGMAAFIKAMSGSSLKFLLVGIAQSLSDLDLDHPSVERQLWAVRVPRMRRDELVDVVNRSLAILRELDLHYTFAASAVERLVEAASGFPWFVHVIGQSSLVAALNNGVHEVTEDLLHQSIEGLVENRFAQQFKDDYQLAIRDSYNREVVLRVFASWRGSDIPTYEVYAVCKKLGVSNPALYKGHLCSGRYGKPLMMPGFQERGLLRFRNEMFKQYVRLTRSLYGDVDEKVRNVVATAWGAGSDGA